MPDKSLKILIAGDSFSSAELSKDLGWPSLLSRYYDTTNISSPGIGEYKILSRIKNQDLNQYDFVIISHTSPNRVHSDTNPLYPPDHVYHNSDLIFSDVESKKHYSKEAEGLFFYFQHVFDPEYYRFIHTKFCEDIDKLSQQTTANFIHITHFDWENLYQFPGLENFYQLWIKHKGDYVHYDIEGNEFILKTILEKINHA